MKPGNPERRPGVSGTAAMPGKAGVLKSRPAFLRGVCGVDSRRPVLLLRCGPYKNIMNNDSFLSALERMGLCQPGENPVITPLTGGVSSDIVRVDLQSGAICIKRALAKLKVVSDWQAPVERNQYEIQWLRIAGGIDARTVPKVLGEDHESGMFAMEFLEEARFPVWKSQLRDGVISVATARDVGQRIAIIHGRTAGRLEIARKFPTDHIFSPIRLEPYLSATASKHPDCADRLESLVRVTGATKKALVHGDVSPKNILAGPQGPVFLDAECAWYGDPAFDLAFCLNHLLLKCIWQPQWQARYLECFGALASTYLENVNWESSTDIEERTAHLLPGLLLGRIDGKSPVEYITAEPQRDEVRHIARALLLKPVDTLAGVRGAWERRLAAH